MEYHVQRHGGEALFAYSVMSVSMLAAVILITVIRAKALPKTASNAYADHHAYDPCDPYHACGAYGENYQAPRQGYQMPRQNYQAPREGYQMPQQNYQAPRQGYQMPQQNYQAPQQDGQMPRQNAQPEFQTPRQNRNAGRNPGGRSSGRYQGKFAAKK